MIQSDPTMINMTMRTPNASASTLLALSGPVVMWMKKTRCTPIWAIASTTSASGMLGPQTRLVPAMKKATTVMKAAASRHLVAAGRLVARRGVAVIENRLDVGLAHQPAPNR
jgi:hypothetical protein